MDLKRMGNVPGIHEVVFWAYIMDTYNICFMFYKPQWDKVSGNIVKSMKLSFQVPNVLVHVHVEV